MEEGSNLVWGHAGVAASLHAGAFGYEEAWDGWDLVVVAEGLELGTGLTGVEEVDGQLLVLGDLVELGDEEVAVGAATASDKEDAAVFCGQQFLSLLGVEVGEILGVGLKVHVVSFFSIIEKCGGLFKEMRGWGNLLGESWSIDGLSL